MEGVSKQNDKFIQMTKAPVEMLVCKLAVPSIITMMVSALYNIADTFFVARLGTSATAAVGVVFSLMSIIQALGFFFGLGAGNYISRELGAKQYEKAAKMASTGFFSAVIAGALLAALGLVFLEPCALLLGSTETILPYACDYLRYILLGAPFIMGSYVLNNLLRFQGNAMYGMVGMVSGVVLNIALAPLLIFVFNMGIAGAAIATMVSQMFSCGLLLVMNARSGSIHISLRGFSPSLRRYRDILNGGVPSLFRQGLQSVAVIFLNQAAGGYGDATIAALSIASRVMMVAGFAMIGFGQGFQPVCGFNYGARRYDRVKKAFWFCVRVSCVFFVVCGVVGVLFAQQIVSIFQGVDAQALEIGALALQLQCVALPLMAWTTMCNMLTQTIGKAARASILAMSRQGIFFIPLVLILPHFLGVLGLQLCQPLSDVCTFVLSVPLMRGVLREMPDTISP